MDDQTSDDGVQQGSQGYGGIDMPVDFQRAIAGRILERVDHQKQFAMDQVGAVSRWLMASLLAVNGGGAIAVLNSTASDYVREPAGLLFSTGVIAALLSGAFMQDTYNNIVSPLMLNDDYWTEVSIHGERDADREDALKSSGLQWYNRLLLPLSGWISGMLFLSAVIVIGFRTDPADVKRTKLCNVAQANMLRHQLSRQDDIELFKALNCKIR